MNTLHNNDNPEGLTETEMRLEIKDCTEILELANENLKRLSRLGPAWDAERRQYQRSARREQSRIATMKSWLGED